ncbi:MAG: hypothetical protein AAGG68_26715, partial [Bacteroidota bacterium]
MFIEQETLIPSFNGFQQNAEKQICFTCPNDCIVNTTFQQKNQYFSSLGNSGKFTRSTTNLFIKLIQEKEIQKSIFIPSSDNRIVLDVPKNEDFSNVKGLASLYCRIVKQKGVLELSWQTMNRQFLIFSYCLNEEIKKLQLKSGDTLEDQLKIRNQIYDGRKTSFMKIHSD